MTILKQVHDHILTIEIAKPEKRNTFDSALVLALKEAFLDATNTDEIRVVLLTARQGLFSAGIDLTSQPSTEDIHDLIHTMAACTKPIIACVEGPAVGLAVGLLYLCDMVYASTQSLFSLPFTALGLTPRYATSKAAGATLNRTLTEKLLLSEPINARQAQDMQLVTQIFEEDKIREQCLARAVRLARLSPQSVQQTKRLICAQTLEGLAQTLSEESAAFLTVAESPAAKEAAQAFLEGRKPNFD